MMMVLLSRRNNKTTNHCIKKPPYLLLPLGPVLYVLLLVFQSVIHPSLAASASSTTSSTVAAAPSTTAAPSSSDWNSTDSNNNSTIEEDPFPYNSTNVTTITTITEVDTNTNETLSITSTTDALDLREHLIGGTLLTQGTGRTNNITLGLINGGNSFFVPIRASFQQSCERYDITCYIASHSDEYSHGILPCPDFRVETVRTWIEWGFITAIALKPCQAEENGFIEEAYEAGIPIVTFDSDDDSPNTTRLAYVGTDQVMLGRTLARLLRQLRPDGGTFGLIGSKAGRDEGFIEEITKYNDREDRAHWYPSLPEAPYNLTEGLGFMSMMEQYAAQNVTALICMKQTPMKEENWTKFVDEHRDQNITYLGTDGDDFQLAYLSQLYVDGLVGQLPWEIGSTCVDVLMDHLMGRRDGGGAEEDEDGGSTNETSIARDFYPTNLVAYNLIPIELPKVDFNQNLLGRLRWIGISCFIVIAISSVLCIGWMLYHRKNSMVIAATQPFFLIMTAVGVLLMGATLIPLSFDDGGDIYSMSHAERKTLCMSIPWLAFLGFSVVFSALFTKTWRLTKLVNKSAAFGRLTVTVWDVLGPFALILISNVAVLVVWTFVDPLVYTREFDLGVDYWNREISSSGSCKCDHAAAFLVPLGLINFSVVVVACHQAIRARNIKSEFSESKYIGLAVFSMTQAFLTGIPIVAVVRDFPKAFYLVLTFVIFILCVVVLSLIFLPKVLLQRRYAGMSKADQKKLMTMAMSVRRHSVSLEQNYYDETAPPYTSYAAAAMEVRKGSQFDQSPVQSKNSPAMESSSPSKPPSKQGNDHSFPHNKSNSGRPSSVQPVLSSTNTQSTADPSLSGQMPPNVAQELMASDTMEQPQVTSDDVVSHSEPQSDQQTLYSVIDVGRPATTLFREMLALTSGAHRSETTALETFLSLVDRSMLSESEQLALDDTLQMLQSSVSA